MEKSENIFNEQVTQRLKQDPKLRLYVEWAQQNGIIMDKIDFPAAFGSNNSYYMGSSAKEDIKHNEAFVYVPNKCLITVERARSSEIGFIFDNHDNLFKATEDRDFLTILVFMLYEFQKGEESFWYPYFNAVDPGELTCYWDEKYIKSLDDAELQQQIKAYGESMEEMWSNVQKTIRVYSPDYFNLDICNDQLFRKVACFIATRCFGWGLPTTILAPIIDSFNHSPRSNNHIDFINKRLHLAQNKIYAYQFNFDADQSQLNTQEHDYQYDKSHSKLNFNVTRLFKEDTIEDPNLKSLIQGQQITQEDDQKKYDEQEVFKRFTNLMRAESENQDEDETEESKKEKFQSHGIELWGIGYVSSDYEQDDDEDAHEEEDSHDCVVNEDLKRKILTEQCAPDEFTIDEFEQISSNTRLREIYSYRWWQDDDNETYFVIINRHGREVKRGDQIYYNYGKRTNAYLLENYGFVLDEKNPYNSLDFRVILGVSPKEQINLAQDLMPDQKLLDDRENIDTTTELMRLKPYRVSEGLFGYLRSVLQNNYTGADSSYIAISFPRVIDYELLIIDFAIDLLDCYAKRELFKRSTLEQDQIAYQNEQDWKMRFIIQHNIQRKLIWHKHMKLLKVMKAILESITYNQDTFTRATLRRIEGVEDQDSDYEMFKRRMGMRNYFKELKMNIERIKKSKAAKSAPKKEFKEEKKSKKNTSTTAKNNDTTANTSQMSTSKGMRSTSQSIKSKATSSNVAVKSKKKK